MAKKKEVVPVAKGATIGRVPTVVRTRISIMDGTGAKDRYMAKYTVYNVDPAHVQSKIKDLLESLQKEWEKGAGVSARAG